MKLLFIRFATLFVLFCFFAQSGFSNACNGIKIIALHKSVDVSKHARSISLFETKKPRKKKHKKKRKKKHKKKKHTGKKKGLFMSNKRYHGIR